MRKVVGRCEAKFCQTVKPLLGRKPRCQHSEVLVPQNKYVLRSESTSSERIEDVEREVRKFVGRCDSN